jgi:hypothetical protein
LPWSTLWLLLLLLLLLRWCVLLCRQSKVTVDRYSEPHYFNGFQWQLVLQVGGYNMLCYYLSH